MVPYIQSYSVTGGIYQSKHEQLLNLLQQSVYLQRTTLKEYCIHYSLFFIGTYFLTHTVYILVHHHIIFK